jgi:hypothetical protein
VPVSVLVVWESSVLSIGPGAQTENRPRHRLLSADAEREAIFER